MTSDTEAERVVEASASCPTCAGRGIIETGEMENGPGGLGFASVPCADCHGTGEIMAEDHEAFKFQHGMDVTISGAKRVVFFDYDGDDIFIWWLPGDACTDGEHLTENERQSVYEQIDQWYRSYTDHDPYDDWRS
jgi:hypothetical protein